MSVEGGVVLSTDAALSKYSRLVTLDRDQTEIILPGSVDFLGDVNRENSRYRIDVRPHLFGQLLHQEFHLTPDQIENIDIFVVGQGRLTKSEKWKIYPYSERVSPRLVGNIDFDDRTGRQRIIIWMRSYWSDFKDERKLLLHYAKSQNKEKRLYAILGKKMEIFDVDEDMLMFLGNESVEAIDRHLGRLASERMKEKLREAIAHEGGHAFVDLTPDFVNNAIVQKFVGKVPKRMPIPVLSERLAKRAEKDILRNPQYLNLVDFTVLPQAA